MIILLVEWAFDGSTMYFVLKRNNANPIFVSKIDLVHMQIS